MAINTTLGQDTREQKTSGLQPKTKCQISQSEKKGNSRAQDHRKQKQKTKS